MFEFLLLVVIIILVIRFRIKSAYKKGFLEGRQDTLRALRYQIRQVGKVDKQNYTEVENTTWRSDMKALLEQAITKEDFLKEEAAKSNLTTSELAEEATEEVASSEAAAAEVSLSEVVTAEGPDLAPSKEEFLTEFDELEKPALANQMRNLNILLGLGSLLFVAAGIAFISSGVSSSMKLIGILVIVAVFYCSGLALYLKSKLLRPAAIALVGTGLALIPFIAVAFNVYGDVPSDWAWLIVSVIGFFAYAFAATWLQNQVVAYLTIGFLISMVGSGVTVGELELFWYGVSFIALSLIFSSISLIKPQPSWLPKLFSEPIAYAGQFLAPTVMLISIMCTEQLSLLQYQALFALLTLHYAVAWLQSRQFIFGQVARALLQITAMIVWYDLADNDFTMLAVGWILIALIQQIVALVRVYLKPKLDSNLRNLEAGWIVAMCLAQVMLQIVYLPMNTTAGYATAFYSLWLLLGVAAVWVFRWASFLTLPIISLAMLPLTVGLNLISPALPEWVIALAYVIMTVAVVVAQHLKLDKLSLDWQQAGMAAVVIFLTLGTIFLYSTSGHGVGLALAVIFLTTSVALSHIYKKPSLAAVFALYFGLIGWRFAGVIGLKGPEMLTITLLAVVVLAYLGTLIYSLFEDRTRRLINLSAAQVIVIPMALSLPWCSLWWSQEVGQMIAAFVLFAGVVINLFAKITLTAKDKKVTKDDFEWWLHFASYLAYYFAAFAICLQLPTGWLIGALALGVGLLWELSYSSSRPLVVFAANLVFVWFMMELLSLTSLATEWLLFSSLAISGLLMYLVSWLFWYFDDSERQKYMLWSSWAAFAFGSLIGVDRSDLRITGASLMLFGAATLAVEGIQSRVKLLVEVSGYIATLALTIILLEVFDFDSLVYVHIWAAVIALMGVYRSDVGSLSRLARFKVGMAVLTLFVGLQALSSGGIYSALFLVEHVLLLGLGALFNAQWAVRWGIIASVLAVMYYLRESAYMVFAVLGLVVISFVVWRLSKMKKPPEQ